MCKYCGNDDISKGMCRKHYQRVYRRGTPYRIGRLSGLLQEDKVKRAYTIISKGLQILPKPQA